MSDILHERNALAWAEKQAEPVGSGIVSPPGQETIRPPTSSPALSAPLLRR